MSFDTQEENLAFAANIEYPLPLLCDVTREVGALYETQRAPEEVMPEWAKRRTYLIDPAGVIAKAYRVRDAGEHPDEVLADLRSFVASPA